MAKTYEEILGEMLARVPDDLNKEADSPVYIALAPMAAISAEQRVYNENIFDATMPDTARGDEQTRVNSGFGVNREPATYAVRKGVFMDQNGEYMDIPIPSRYGANGIAYVAIQKIEAGVFQLQCEVLGTIGNTYFGPILPLDESIVIGSAELEDVLIPGEETDDDETYRAKFFRAVNTRVTGSNMAWYEQEIGSIPGVGNCKIFPTPDGQGGHVHAVIVGPGNAIASQALIDSVKDIMDPEPSGSGSGRAPIEHRLSVSTVSEVDIGVGGLLWLRDGYSLDSVRDNIRLAIESYLHGIAFTDFTVRISRIESAIIESEGVQDYDAITVNGGTENISLSADWNNYQIPKLGNTDFTLGV